MFSRTCTAVLAALVAACVMTAPVAAQDAPDALGLDAKDLLKSAVEHFLQAGAARNAAAEESKAPPEPKQFGALTNTTFIPPSRFVPWAVAPQNYLTFILQPGNLFFPYYQPSSGGGVFLWAPVDLPPGTSVSDVCILAFDNDPGANADVLFIFTAYETGSAFVAHAPAPWDFFGRLPGWVLSSGGTTGNPGGFTEVCDTPFGSATFPVTLRAAAINIDGDADSGRTHYEIVVFVPDDSDDPDPAVGPFELGFGGAYVKWTRAISTPPSAGFTDIGSLTPNFQQAINALAASQITTGCSTSPPKYCPTDTLTRAQMALFLAKAFGLYWSE